MGGTVRSARSASFRELLRGDNIRAKLFRKLAKLELEVAITVGNDYAWDKLDDDLIIGHQAPKPTVRAVIFASVVVLSR
jgi:hypothetical protein